MGTSNNLDTEKQDVGILSQDNSNVIRSFVFFLVPDFSMLAFSTAIEALRLANRMLSYKSYKWRLASLDGKPVSASNGVEVSVDFSLEEERKMLSGKDRPSMVFVCSGINVENFNNKSVYAWIREEHNRGVAIGGLCTAAHILATAGLLSGKRCAIHWETSQGFPKPSPRLMSMQTFMRWMEIFTPVLEGQPPSI